MIIAKKFMWKEGIVTILSLDSWENNTCSLIKILVVVRFPFKFFFQWRLNYVWVTDFTAEWLEQKVKVIKFNLIQIALKSENF